ncbi:MAG: CSLREA domain-containing protein, partial [Proteobacteria bacterium]|nr:CSLREA domain-containing protein [Pseudomonadota bacterium]
MKNNKPIKRTLQLIMIGLLVIQVTQAGGLQQIVVDSTADQPSPGFTTLREAIEEANTLNESEIIFDSSVFS